jgi:hypothetical protein
MCVVTALLFKSGFRFDTDGLGFQLVGKRAAWYREFAERAGNPVSRIRCSHTRRYRVRCSHLFASLIGASTRSLPLNRESMMSDSDEQPAESMGLVNNSPGFGQIREG